MILTKLDQYTTCVLNKHKVQPCLHYKELRVLVCYWCYNWHLNFGYQLRLPSWNIVNNKYGQIKFDYFLKFKSVPIPPGPYTNYWIPKMNLLYYINTKKKKNVHLITRFLEHDEIKLGNLFLHPFITTIWHITNVKNSTLTKQSILIYKMYIKRSLTKKFYYEPKIFFKNHYFSVNDWNNQSKSSIWFTYEEYHHTLCMIFLFVQKW